MGIFNIWPSSNWANFKYIFAPEIGTDLPVLLEILENRWVQAVRMADL